VLKTGFWAVFSPDFDGSLRLKKIFQVNFFYILSWTILRLSNKENPYLSQNWPQEKLSKLTGIKSGKKTAQKLQNCPT
jgi:hypothetical protein